MADRTDVQATNVRGTDPQNLVERITRLRIYNCRYWKEHCFGLNAETLVEKATALDHIGATFGGNRKPTPFLCLVLKLLQIQPPLEAVVEYVRQDEHKYLRALGAYYLRLVAPPADVYRHLEPLFSDYRKLAVRTPNGWELTHMDEYVDALLRGDETLWEQVLPRLTNRRLLESTGKLKPRASVLSKLVAAAQHDPHQGASSSTREARPGATAPAGRGPRDGRPTDEERGPSADVLKLLAKQRAAVAAAAATEEGARPDRAAPAASSSSGKEAMSVEDWNQVRARLGLKPLRSK